MVCLSVYVCVVVIDLIDERGELVNISDHAMENGVQLFTNRASYILIEVKSTYVRIYVCMFMHFLYLHVHMHQFGFSTYDCTYMQSGEESSSFGCFNPVGCLQQSGCLGSYPP